MWAVASEPVLGTICLNMHGFCKGTLRDTIGNCSCVYIRERERHTALTMTHQLHPLIFVVAKDMLRVQQCSSAAPFGKLELQWLSC